jgi:hypothetical protein
MGNRCATVHEPITTEFCFLLNGIHTYLGTCTQVPRRKSPGLPPILPIGRAVGFIHAWVRQTVASRHRETLMEVPCHRSHGSTSWGCARSSPCVRSDDTASHTGIQSQHPNFGRGDFQVTPLPTPGYTSHALWLRMGPVWCRIFIGLIMDSLSNVTTHSDFVQRMYSKGIIQPCCRST